MKINTATVTYLLFRCEFGRRVLVHAGNRKSDAMRRFEAQVGMAKNNARVDSVTLYATVPTDCGDLDDELGDAEIANWTRGD